MEKKYIILNKEDFCSLVLTHDLRFYHQFNNDFFVKRLLSKEEAFGEMKNNPENCIVVELNTECLEFQNRYVNSECNGAYLYVPLLLTDIEERVFEESTKYDENAYLPIDMGQDACVAIYVSNKFCVCPQLLSHLKFLSNDDINTKYELTY